MKLRIALNQKAFLTMVVALIGLSGITLAYMEDARLAEEARMRAELLRLGGSPDLLSAEIEAFRPVMFLLGGLGLAIFVFVAFYWLWRSRAAAVLESTDQRLGMTRSQERLRSLFENAGEGICGLNKKGEIMFVNPVGATILGASTEELMGCTFASFIKEHTAPESVDDGRIVPTDAPAKHKASLHPVGSENESNSEGSDQYELEVITAAGEKRIIDFTTTPMRGQSEFSSGSVVMFRDITPRVEAENKLREANAELEEFAYRTSHDLRSPIVSAVALMKAVSASLERENVASAQKGLKLSVRALEGLEDLVEDIMALSRTKAEVEDDAQIDFKPLVQKALDRHTYLEGYERLTITQDLRSAGGFLSKPNRVELIVNNLISNAIKYHDPAEAQPVLNISTWDEGNDVFMSIEDNGLGIPEDRRDSLFEMFKRFHPKVSFGSGLGLYMVKKSAEIIGARVDYEPRDKGTRFVVSFPASNESNYIAGDLAA